MRGLLWMVLCANLLAPARVGAAPLHWAAHTKDGSVTVAFTTTRTNALISDVTVTYHSPSAHADRTFTIARADLSGYYFAHERLLLFYTTLVDEREAILDLSFDAAAGKGTLSLQFSPAAVSGRPDLAADAGLLNVAAAPLAPLDVK